MSCNKCLTFSTHNRDMSCHKCLKFSTHTTHSCHVTNVWFRYTCQRALTCDFTNTLYSVHISQSHIMSQMSAVQYSHHRIMSRHVKISDIQYSCHTVKTIQKFLKISTHVTLSCLATSVWYTVFISHSHVMLQMSDNQYSFHTIKSFHVTTIWYYILMLKRHVMSQNLIFSTHATKSCYVISYHKYLTFSTHITESCHVKISDSQYS